MATLTTGMLIVLFIASGITAMAMLSVFANVIGHETQLHDLRNKVKELHYQHAMYLARIEGLIAEEGDVEIIDDAEEDFDFEISQSQDDNNAPLEAQSLSQEPELGIEIETPAAA